VAVDRSRPRDDHHGCGSAPQPAPPPVALRVSGRGRKIFALIWSCIPNAACRRNSHANSPRRSPHSQTPGERVAYRLHPHRGDPRTSELHTASPSPCPALHDGFSEEGATGSFEIGCGDGAGVPVVIGDEHSRLTLLSLGQHRHKIGQATAEHGDVGDEYDPASMPHLPEKCCADRQASTPLPGRHGLLPHECCASQAGGFGSLPDAVLLLGGVERRGPARADVEKGEPTLPQPCDAR
jgi:hypothetical protein